MSPSAAAAAAVSLYRSILQAHKRYLPEQLRSLGDAYVKSEFKLHKATTNQGQLNQFFTAWQTYLQDITKTARVKQSLSTGSLDDEGKESAEIKKVSFGKDLPQDASLSDEQLEQLHKLREEAKKAR